jgi:hypothetical protein
MTVRPRLSVGPLVLEGCEAPPRVPEVNQSGTVIAHDHGALCYIGNPYGWPAMMVVHENNSTVLVQPEAPGSLGRLLGWLGLRPKL